VIDTLRTTYADLRKRAPKNPRPRPWRMCLVHAVLLLCRAPKSRLVDVVQITAFRDDQRKEVPDYALDRHTLRGRRLGKGWDDFWTEGIRLEPHEEQPGEAEWRERAIAAVARDAPPDEPPGSEAQLFE
jgi:hypothetical protein